MDIDSGNWKVVAEENAREILVLFTPNVKRQWKLMSMGSLNEVPTFVAMTMKLQMECDTLTKERGLKKIHQELLLMMCYCMGVQPSSY